MTLPHDNIIYLPRGLVLMVTYSELFQFVIMLCAVITLVIHFTHKNSALALVK